MTFTIPDLTAVAVDWWIGAGFAAWYVLAAVYFRFTESGRRSMRKASDGFRGIAGFFWLLSPVVAAITLVANLVFLMGWLVMERNGDE